MKTIYPTKIGLEFAIPFTIIFIGTTILFIAQKLMAGYARRKLCRHPSSRSA